MPVPASTMSRLIVPGSGGIRGSEVSDRQVEPVVRQLPKAAGEAGS